MKNYSVIIPAAGLGTRFGQDKILYKLNNGNTVIQNSVSIFLELENVKQVIVVVSKENAEKIRRMFLDNRIVVVEGGETRRESVVKGIAKLNDCEYVLIHDGARPFVSKELVQKVMNECGEDGSFPYIDLVDSIVEKGSRLKIANRESYMQLQTPFCFKKDVLLDIYEKCKDGSNDEVSMAISCGLQPRGVVGEVENLKVTNPNDVNKNLYGIGYDVHRLKKGKGLKLCGVELDFNKRPVAHSDGDIPIHAVMDAILSAMGKKDIGHYFPVDDHKYDDADSFDLLKHIVNIMKEERCRVVNVSICIILEKPKIGEYINAMKENIAKALEIDFDRVGITATTNEEVGEIGKGKAIASYVSVLLERF